MSEENVEVVRRCIDAWNKRDKAEAARYLHEQAVFRSAITDLGGKTFYGREAILGFLDQIYEEWSAIRWEVDRYIEVDDVRVVTLHRAIATGRESGVEVVRELGGVWEIRHGLVTSQWIYLDRAEALEAAGLRE